jgi:hypothetical protein
MAVVGVYVIMSGHFLSHKVKRETESEEGTRLPQSFSRVHMQLLKRVL